MVGLAEQKRVQYQVYQPVFWRKAHDSREKQATFFQGLLTRQDIIALVHSLNDVIDGFIIGTLDQAPPVYDPGGLTCTVDDFVVAQPADWSTVGRELLGALVREAGSRGAVQTAVVCGQRDELKRTMLAASGFTVASEWFVGPIPPDQ